jgi:hypothetical protein
MSLVPPLNPAKPRDLSVDILRGFFLVVLIAAHFGHSTWTSRLLHIPLLVDAASGFVALSGFTLGMLDRRRRDLRGKGYPGHRVLKRALMVWGIHITILTVTFLYDRYVAPVAKFSDEARNLPLWRYMLESACFIIRPAFSTIFPLFVVCFAAAPTALKLISSGRSGFVFMATVGLYVFGWLFPEAVPFTRAFPNAGGVPALFSWQVLYFLGMIAGYHLFDWHLRTDRASGEKAALAGCGLVAISFLVLAMLQRNRLEHLGFRMEHETYLRWFSRPAHAPGRLLYFFSCAPFALLFSAWVTRQSWLKVPANWLAVIGSQSLAVYTMHFVPMAMLGILHPEPLRSPSGDAIIYVLLVGTYWFAYGVRAYRQKLRLQDRAREA